MHKLLVGAHSDIGPRRRDNQDSGYAADDLLLIADGVGGSPAGDLASAIVTRGLAKGLTELTDPTEPALRAQLALANSRLASASRADPRVKGMATTMTGLVLAYDHAYIIHVGDSRAYRWRDGRLKQLTIDQSWIQLLLDDGLVKPADAHKHPMRNMLMHSLSGALSDPEWAKIIPVDLRIGDRWLLATDGLTSYLPEDALNELVGDVEDPQDLADRLVQHSWALSRDNISVVIGDVTAGVPQRHGRFIGAAAGPLSAPGVRYRLRQA